jgi:hypothetical protein
MEGPRVGSLVLRRASGLIRARAEAHLATGRTVEVRLPVAYAAHYAALNPEVALALADWLDHSAKHAESREKSGMPVEESVDPRPLRVALAYLGEQVLRPGGPT